MHVPRIFHVYTNPWVRYWTCFWLGVLVGCLAGCSPPGGECSYTVLPEEGCVDTGAGDDSNVYADCCAEGYEPAGNAPGGGIVCLAGAS